MENKMMDKLFLQVAEKHGVDSETVRKEIRDALHEAQISPKDKAHVFWQAMPEDATEMDIVLCIAKLLQSA